MVVLQIQRKKDDKARPKKQTKIHPRVITFKQASITHVIGDHKADCNDTAIHQHHD